MDIVAVEVIVVAQMIAMGVLLCAFSIEEALLANPGRHANPTRSQYESGHVGEERRVHAAREGAASGSRESEPFLNLSPDACAGGRTEKR